MTKAPKPEGEVAATASVSPQAPAQGGEPAGKSASAASLANADTVVPAIPTRPAKPASDDTTRSLTWTQRILERRRERGARGRRAADRPPEPKVEQRRIPSVQPGTRTENVVATFLFGVIVGCAGVWIEHNRCPGALKTAAYAAAPGAFAIAVPIAAAIAFAEKGATRAVKTQRAILFALWAGAAALAVATAGVMWWNERGPLSTETARCRIARRETVAAPTSGVADWIVVISCSDRMSLVHVDVDRAKWWASEPGGAVDATLVRGPLGFAWVVDVPTLGQPKRSL